MKTKEQFEKMASDFYYTIYGKVGDAFFDAVLAFMDKHKFQNNVIARLHQSDSESVLFFTDHPLNDMGIVFVEAFDKQSLFYVGSKREAQIIILNRQLKDLGYIK